MNWHDPVQVILAYAMFSMLASVVLYSISLAVSRFVFGGYIKRRHPALWEALASADARVTVRVLASDVSDAMHEFRTRSVDDHGDPRIGTLRRFCRAWTRVSMSLAALTLVLAIAAFIVAATK